MENKYSFKVPQVEELLKAGSQFGHSTQRWHPAFAEFVYKMSKGIHIIDVRKTLPMLEKAGEFLSAQVANEQSRILIVGTKKQAAPIVQEIGEKYGVYYVSDKWPSGLLTNYKMVSQSISKLVKLKEQVIKKRYILPKKELLSMQRDINSLEKRFKGVMFIDRLPTVIIIVDTKFERISVKEARALKIPVIGIVDSNCDPRLIDYPIAANDDAIKSIRLLLEMFSDILSQQKTPRILNMRAQFAKQLIQLEGEIEQEHAIKMKSVGGPVTIIAQPVFSEQTESGEGKRVRVSSYRPITELNLPKAVEDKLISAGVTSVELLAQKSLDELKGIKGIGEKTAKRIISLTK